MVVVLAIFAFSTPVFAGYNMAFCSVCDNGDIEMVLKYRTGNFCNFQSNETRNEYEEEVQKV
jgi:hypothetical protein